ncbi:MAG: hypothetical protein Phog2KO_36760 [Phototrophicaceae bacterium]
MLKFSRLMLIGLIISLFSLTVMALDEDLQPAPIVNDEGGPVIITGDVTYTNAFFTADAEDGFIILEDQTGFVSRNFDYVFPPESQVFAQITSDVYESPFTYIIQLPTVPQAPLNDVDNDDEEDIGVQIFQIAYWSNTYGDIYLEERDGGAWSGNYSSVITESEPPERIAEYIGGNILIYSPVEGEAFPTGFGEDGALFTEDDPLVIVPQGWTIVNMDTEVFTFDRSREPQIDLYEAEGAELDDFSQMSYTEAFDAMMEKMRNEYSFTEFAGIDWDEIDAQFRPLFEEAEENNDAEAYYYAIFEFTVLIGDRHTNSNATNFLIEDFREETAGGLGIAIRELSDGRVIVNYLGEDTPADDAGIELGAEIIAIDGVPIMDAVMDTLAWSEPFNTEHVRILQRLRYVTRSPIGTEVELTFANPDGDEETVDLTFVEEPESFSFSSFNVGITGVELPVQWEIVENMMLVDITSFLDSPLLTIRLWERMLADARNNQVDGIIIDMRNNGGGFGSLADNMASYFFDEEFVLGNSTVYNENIDGFLFDDRFEETLHLPDEELRYYGPVAVLVGPNCFSACEFFSYNMTVDDRAAIVGHYPTIGGGGGTEVFLMPGGISMQMTIGRSVDGNGDIHIQNQGVAPTVVVPVDEDTLGLTDVTYVNDDPVLAYAIDALLGQAEEALANIDFVDAGEIGYDEEITGEIEVGQRIRYEFTIEAGADPVGVFILGDLDTYLRIYDETGSDILAENDDYAGTLNSGFPGIVLDQDLVVVLEVATFDDAEAGEYTLVVTTGEEPFSADVEEGDDIAVGDTVEGSLSAGSRIAYSLDLEADEEVNIYLNGVDGLDTYLRIYDVDGELIAENDDFDELSSGIEGFSVDEDATVTVEVATFGDSEDGDFELIIEAVE